MRGEGEHEVSLLRFRSDPPSGCYRPRDDLFSLRLGQGGVGRRRQKLGVRTPDRPSVILPTDGRGPQNVAGVATLRAMSR